MGVGRTEGPAPREGAGLLSAIVEGTPDAVFVKDLEGRYLMVNSACARILGRPKEEIVGRVDAQILPPETAWRLAGVDRLVMDTGEASSHEEVLPVAGRPRIYLSTKSVHRDAAGNAVGIIGISRDITERKMAEQELRRSEEHFRSLAEGVAFIPWEADLATWRFTYVGPQAAEILGYPPEDWYRDDGFWVDRIHPEDRGWVTEYCATRSASKRRYRFEYRMLGSDGRIVWLDDIVSVVDGRDGTKRLQGVMVDITERKRTEERLRSSKDQLDAILRSVADGITAQEPSGRLIYANEAAARLVGYPSAGELLEAPAQEILDGFEIMDRSGRPFPLDRLPGRRALGGEGAPEELLCFRAKATDERRWSVVRATPIFDGEGEVRLAVNIFRDVTESRRAEEERARLAAIVRSSDDAIFGKTLDGTITSWNPGAEKIYGYPAEEAVGRPVSILVPPELPDEIPSILERVGRGEVVSHETVRLAKDGRKIDVSLTVSPIKDPGGEVVGASTIVRDITERKRAEAAEFEVREAERSRLARDLHDGALQDLSVVVQQLEAKRVASEMEGSDSGLDREIEALRRAVRGLREAVYDLRPGEEELFLERLKEMVGYYRDLTPEREVDLAVEEDFPKDLPEGVSTQLLRLVREALTNARQHSAARRVRVTLGADEDQLGVEVADDGRGFAAGATDGGMGLSTMRERAALLGGELEVSSEPGEGTSVRLRMPRPDDAS